MKTDNHCTHGQPASLSPQPETTNQVQKFALKSEFELWWCSVMICHCINVSEHSELYCHLLSYSLRPYAVALLTALDKLIQLLWWLMITVEYNLELSKNPQESHTWGR